MPEVKVSGADLAEQADQTWDALIRTEDPLHPSVMFRGNVLSRLAADEGVVRLERHTQVTLRDLLSRRVRFYKLDKEGAEYDVKPPTDVVQTLLQRPPDALPGTPRVNRVTDVAVFSRDERLQEDEGYHAGSSTYYRPQSEDYELPSRWIGSEATALRREDVSNAKELLRELVRDFPFADQASRAHALALICEPFMREMIGDEPTPMYVIIAPEHGTGKSLLAQVCLIPGCGKVAPQPPPEDRNSEALQKRLTSLFLQGPSAIWFDNCPKLDSPVLASALTASRWTDRRLGVSEMVNEPIRNVWLSTLNNPTISDEMARRIVPIYLDSGVAEPWTRKGPAPDKTWAHHLPGWAFENRPQLVRAAQVLVQHYAYRSFEVNAWDIEAELLPWQSSDLLGSYEKWSQVMGGLLTACGVGEHFLTNRESLRDDVSDTLGESAYLLRMWHTLVVDSITVDELLEKLTVSTGIGDNGLPLDPLPTPLSVQDRNGHVTKKLLAYWLRSNRGRIIDGYRLEHDSGRPKRWTVKKVTP